MKCLWIIFNIIAIIISVRAHVQDLRVDVIPIHGRVAAVQKVNVVLKYTNVGTDTIGIYKWYIPTKSLTEPLFTLTLNGEHVNYVGPIMKRRAPTENDVIPIAPGATISTIVDLSLAYNMTQSGNYMIEYKMISSLVVSDLKGETDRSFLSVSGGKGKILKSETIVLFIAAHRNPIVERANMARTQAKALAPVYYGCSSARIREIVYAVNAAEIYTTDAVEHLSRRPIGTTRYRTWFGSYNSANWLKLKSHFTKIHNVLTNEELSFDCLCEFGDDDTYAYVYPFLLYDINLCGRFWEALTMGTDSQAGTLIHEIAHFTDTASTEDHAYGQGQAKYLATTNPEQALMNSDNLQYFAENDPQLN